MGKGRVRTRVRGSKSTKASRWRKGHSSSSNPTTKKHRLSAKGRFSGHLAQAHSPASGPTLTAEVLASHDARQEDDFILDREGDVEFSGGEEEGESRTLTSAATSTAYSLIETAHPVFGRVKRLWNSPLESHREICAVLAAVSEVVKTHDGKGTESEFFGALMTALESADDEKSTMAIAYLLSIIISKVPAEILQSRYGSVCKIIVEILSAHETSDSTALLKSLVNCLTVVLSAQNVSVWSDGYTHKVFQMLLNYTLHPKPKLRKAAQAGVISLLREGTSTGEFHPSTFHTAKHCKHVIDKGGAETSTLHVLVLLRECLANFTSQQIKMLCEAILKLINLGNSVVRITGLRALHGLFSSVAGPQGLTAQLNGQLISALYDHQPSLVDSQMLQAWLTVMQSAHTRLSRMDLQLCVAHLPRLFSTCVSCLLSNKVVVMETAATSMEVLLKDCVEPYLESFNQDSSGKRDLQLASLQNTFKSVEGGLKYKFFPSWAYVLRVLGTLYRVAGKQCHSFLAKSLVSLCELRSTADFPYTTELDSAFGAAVGSMGPRIVLTVVPLQLDTESDSHDFLRSWMLPAMVDHVHHTELAYFTEALLPLAGRLRAKGQQCSQAGKLLEAKLYDTLQFQIWSLLPGFCTSPVDLAQSFRPLARLLGTALSERADLRTIVCHSLQLLIEGSRDSEENCAVLARFAKNYLPILFNLYTSTHPPSSSSSSSSHPSSPMDPTMAPLLECVRAYASITEQKLLEEFFKKAMDKLRQEDLPTATKCLVFDLVHKFVPYIPTHSLNELFGFVSPRLDSANRMVQKKAYSILEHILTSNSPAHLVFQREHLEQLRTTLLESLSTAHPAAKRPRLKCLLHLVDHLTPEGADFITAIVPEVILCTKETSEKVRRLSFKLLVNMGYAAQRCFRKSAEESVTEYFLIVLAGLAGSCHMISATILALSRLVYEFYDLLGCDLVKRLLCSTCVFLSSKRREVVKATLEFVKVTTGVLPASELLPHVEELVLSVLRWSGKSGNHFRAKARVILERLIRKFGYEMVANMVPEKHQKLMVHIRRMTERERRKRGEEKGGKVGVEDGNLPKRRHIPSYEELLYESEEEEEEEGEEEKTRKKLSTKLKPPRSGGNSKVRTTAKTPGGTWIREGDGEEPVNFLDPQVVKRVVATNPSEIRRRKVLANPFKTTPEGKLLIAEEGESLEQGGAAAEGMEMDKEEAGSLQLSKSMQVKVGRKRKLHATRDEEESAIGGGVGIRRRDPAKHDFDYGAEYRAKKAKGDVKRPGKPDPFAYVPLMRQKLNRRKRAKLSGQFGGLMRRAKKGSALGTKQLKRRRK